MEHSEELVEIDGTSFEYNYQSSDNEELASITGQDAGVLDEDGKGLKIELNYYGKYKQFCITEECFKQRDGCLKPCKPEDSFCVYKCNKLWGGARPKSRKCEGRLSGCYDSCTNECFKIGQEEIVQCVIKDASDGEMSRSTENGLASQGLTDMTLYKLSYHYKAQRRIFIYSEK